MQSLLYAEINLVGIILLLVILLNQRQSTGISTAQIQFNVLIISGLIMLAVDSCCWLIDGKQFLFARELAYTVETLFYVMNILMPYFWMRFTEFALNANRTTAIRNTKIAAIPLVILFAALVLNFKFGFVFTIDSNNVYHRAAGFVAYAILAYGYLAYATVLSLKMARSAAWAGDRRRYHVMAFFMVPPFLGGVIQVFWYGVNFTWVLASISILLVYIDSQNRQISTDPLTSLNNRHELAKFLLREMKEPSKSSAVTLIMMDIDKFKQINDTYGHFCGDRVLVAVSDILKMSCKNTPAFLARYGGDEFCVVLPAAAESGADAMIARVRAGISEWNSSNPDKLPIGMSFGVAEWNAQRNESYESLICRADEKMYQEKNSKKSK